MAGLFEKDIRLIMQRKNVLMIFKLLSVVPCIYAGRDIYCELPAGGGYYYDNRNNVL